MGKYLYNSSSPNLFGFDNPLSGINIPANGSVQNQEIRIEQDAYLVFNRWAAVSTGRFKCFIHDSTGSNYMNVPIEGGILFGTSKLPFNLAMPLVMGPNTRLFFDFYDLSGAPNAVSILAQGYKHLDKSRPPVVGTMDPVTKIRRSSRDKWYIYAADHAIPSGYDETTINVTIDDGARFFAVNKRAYALNGGLSGFQSIVKSASTDWSRNFVRGDLGWGDSQYPNLETPAKILKPQAVVTFRVKDLAGAPAQSVQTALEGFRRWE